MIDQDERRTALHGNFFSKISGCLISIFSTRFDIMLIGRFIQGIGAAGPRTAIIALVRDLHGGRTMARIMSVIMAVFIFIPAVAPALGQTVQARGPGFGARLRRVLTAHARRNISPALLGRAAYATPGRSSGRSSSAG